MDIYALNAVTLPLILKLLSINTVTHQLLQLHQRKLYFVLQPSLLPSGKMQNSSPLKATTRFLSKRRVKVIEIQPPEIVTNLSNFFRMFEDEIMEKLSTAMNVNINYKLQVECHCTFVK